MRTTNSRNSNQCHSRRSTRYESHILAYSREIDLNHVRQGRKDQTCVDRLRENSKHARDYCSSVESLFRINRHESAVVMKKSDCVTGTQTFNPRLFNMPRRLSQRRRGLCTRLHTRLALSKSMRM